jgi:structural maintenance of chromosome 3 (chondroitin sulfate proteoglycan 6)
LTGGYHDIRRSRIDGVKSVGTWRTKYEAERTRSGEVKKEILKLEQEITRVGGKVTVLMGQQNQIRDSRDRLVEEGISLAHSKEKLKARVSKLEQEKEELETELSSLETKVAGYQSELATPLTNGITRDEEQMIVTLGKEVERRRKDMVELSKRRNEVGLITLSLT